MEHLGYLLLLAKRKIKPRFSLGVLALACDPIKNQHLVISRLKKIQLTLMASKLEPTLSSHDIGQWVPFFDRC